jgi:UDP-N-acetylmuramate dehydrogenase
MATSGMSEAVRATVRIALQGVRGIVRENVDLAPLTHVRIGGPAAFFVEPLTVEGVSQVVQSCRDADVPLHVLGGGSNLVIADGGVAGVVMTLASLGRIVRDGEQLSAEAGATLPSLVRKTKDLGLAGLESLVGIPAVVGGAVAMNAGTREGETFDHLVSLMVCDGAGQLFELSRAELEPGYRDARLGDRIVLAATFALRRDDPAAIFRRLEASLKRRNATQPVTEKSVGCVFRNPPKDSAGRLIEAAGCKLLRRGDVSVSAKHANYFVNHGGGTSADFLELMQDVRERVRRESGVELEPEVKFWGL